ncbi:PEP-CTERM sorting domain-containing protein [Cerasicoccus frondis]|uniref:PEP-CTERM sorting domain-containing protein n=1 Tax=Cerasicoccus frondis TaxID=490090 RepID=UPI0028528A75|nr:PEP-CTERM sorting domain-containing protein [Cerasicoccus frondis]
MRLLSTILLAAVIPAAANAMVLIEISKSGGDVFITGSGSIDLTGAIAAGTESNSVSIIIPSSGTIRHSNGPGTTYERYQGGRTGNYGAGGQTNNPEVSAGTPFGFTTTRLLVPTGYVSGTPINFTMIFENTNFADLGIDESGSVTFTLAGSGDTVHIAVVPEPSTYIAGAGFLALGFFVWRRRKKAKATAEQETAVSA